MQEPMYCANKCLILNVLLLTFSASYCQTSYVDQIPQWKKLFPKEDVIAASYKEVVNFSINPNPKPDEGIVQASVQNEMTILPLKDYVKYEDGVGYNDEISVDNLKVVSPEGKEVSVQKTNASFNEDYVFHSDQKICIYKFPLKEKGKPFTCSYLENFHDVKYLTSIYFHNHFAAAERIIEFNIPSWIDVKLNEFNFPGYTIEKTSVKQGDITKVTYKMTNLPAFVSEPHSPNRALSYPHVICVCRSYNDKNQQNTLFSNVKDLYSWYSFVCSDIGNKPDDLKAKVSELTFNKKTDLEKIESIFYWVQDHIRYIAFENGIMGFKPDAAQNVLNKKYGDCKGKANLLKEMLKLAGFDARLTWIGTSDLPYDYSLPSLTVDNHMICTVILNGKKYFLDGTEENIALNDYAQRIQGKQVLIEDGKNYILETVPQFPSERNKEIKKMTLSISDDKLIGTGEVIYNGESKISVLGAYASIRNENKLDDLANFIREGDNNVEVSEIKNSDFSERQKPLQLNYHIKASNQITKANNELYIVMDWDKDFTSLEMPAERINDYEFNQKYYKVTETELTIPAGYKIESLPVAVKKSNPDFSFEGSYQNKGKTIVYKKTIIINKPILRKSDFPQWNTFISDINKFYNDQVVLTK
ncbi:MAG: transglutaminase domain-containing protein [Flavisolibacter sp.]